MKILKTIIATIFIIFPLLGFSNDCDKKLSTTEEKYKSLISMADQYGRPTYTKANILVFKKNLDEARESCKNNIDLESINVHVLLILGDHLKAKSESENLIKNHPDSALAFSTASMATSAFGDFEKEVMYLKKAINLDSDNEHLQFNLCSIMENNQYYEEAIIECGKSISRGKTHRANAYFVRARAYKSIGREAQANKDFNTAKQLGSDAAKYYSEEHYGKK